MAVKSYLQAKKWVMILWFRVVMGEHDLVLTLEKLYNVICQWCTESQETFRQRLHYWTNMVCTIKNVLVFAVLLIKIKTWPNQVLVDFTNLNVHFCICSLQRFDQEWRASGWGECRWSTQDGSPKAAMSNEPLPGPQHQSYGGQLHCWYNHKKRLIRIAAFSGILSLCVIIFLLLDGNVEW